MQQYAIVVQIAFKDDLERFHETESLAASLQNDADELRPLEAPMHDVRFLMVELDSILQKLEVFEVRQAAP